jgi:hypothetical protein
MPTSTFNNHKVERSREWTKMTHVISRSRVGNESEEELTGKVKGITVHQTVEIRSLEREVGDKRRIIIAWIRKIKMGARLRIFYGLF